MRRQQDFLQEWRSLVASRNFRTVVIYILSCVSVSADVPTSSPTFSLYVSEGVDCIQVCRYEEFYRRAHCDQRSLHFVPAPTGCEGVELLELQGNNIATITEQQMSQYIRVGTLDISNNQIVDLNPGTFLKNEMLRNIIASHNKLRVLKSGTFNGTEQILSRVYLDDNELETIEDNAFHGLRKVTIINLNNNRLKYLPNNVFNDMVELNVLSLSNNSLLEINGNCFRNVKRLQILHLDSNNLTTIPAGLFEGLNDLQKVNLSNNRLTMIPSPEEFGLHHLQVLDLTNNKLRQTFFLLPFLSNVTDLIHFGGNPLSCDCDFQIVQNWFHEIPESLQSSLSTVGCTADNGTTIAIQNTQTFHCVERDMTTSPPDETSPTRPFGKRAKDPRFRNTQDDVELSQDTDEGYHFVWLSWYTAIILTLYVFIRFIAWFLKNYKSRIFPQKCLQSLTRRRQPENNTTEG